MRHWIKTSFFWLVFTCAMAVLVARPSVAQQFGPAPMGPMGPMAPMAGPPMGGCAMCGGEGCPACDDGSGGCDMGDCGYGDGGHGCNDQHEASLEQVGSFIDCPIPMTQVKVRYDRATNFQDFDRAAYFFPTTVANGGQLPVAENVLDLEEITTIIEVAFCRRISAFVELPGRIVQSELAPQLNGGVNRDGFGDLRAGGKFAVIANDCKYLTAQVRLYMPTGDATEALGTGHTSIEAGLLYQWNYCEGWTLTAEVLDWQAINSPTIPGTGNLFTGNVIQYGLGTAYDLCSHRNLHVSASAEFIAWTIIDGYESAGLQRTAESADGDTIVNGYFGLRANWCNHTFYAGYGTRISDEHWYEEIYRLEYAWRF